MEKGRAAPFSQSMMPSVRKRRRASIAASTQRQISPGTARMKQYSTTGQMPMGVPRTKLFSAYT